MNDTQGIYKTIIESLETGRETALVTLIETNGSTPNDVGNSSHNSKSSCSTSSCIMQG